MPQQRLIAFNMGVPIRTGATLACSKFDPAGDCYLNGKGMRAANKIWGISLEWTACWEGQHSYTLASDNCYAAIWRKVVMAKRDTGQRGAARELAAPRPDAHSDETTGIRPWWASRRLAATGRLVGLAAVISATVIAVGTPLTHSPSAIADKGNRNTPSVTGQAVVPTATVSGVADPTEGAQYFGSIMGSYNDMQAALRTIGNGLQNPINWDTIKAGCQQLSNAGALLKSTLPSPDSRVTFRIQSAVDNINTASDICNGLGPTSTQADLDHMMSFVNTANGDFKAVKQILSH